MRRFARWIRGTLLFQPKPSWTCGAESVNRNVWVLLAVSALFGLAFGVYELALPLYLKSKHISMVNMGWIFAIPAIATFVIRIGFGSISDSLRRRKPFYTGSLGLCTLACAMTPLNALVLVQVLTKCLHQAAVELRKTLHSVLLFEAAEERFLDNIGKTTGAEFLLMGVGTVVGGYWMRSRLRSGIASEESVFWVCVAMLGLCGIVFAAWFNENEIFRPPPRRSAWREILAVDLDRRLVLMTASMFVFNIGLSCSHCQVMPLFFKDKFHFANDVVGWVMAGHRFTIAVPLILVGAVLKRPHKWVLIGFTVLEGLVLSASGLIARAGIATAVWLLHDLLGAGIWQPTQMALIQQFARPESRGAEVSKVMSLSYLGWVVGPPLAGVLYRRAFGLPFVAGGALMVLSGLMLIPLRVPRAGEEAARP